MLPPSLRLPLSNSVPVPTTSARGWSGSRHCAQRILGRALPLDPRVEHRSASCRYGVWHGGRFSDSLAKRGRRPSFYYCVLSSHDEWWSRNHVANILFGHLGFSDRVARLFDLLVGWSVGAVCAARADH
jgi:hypothetical protein